jgi:hypothetical protein
MARPTEVTPLWKTKQAKRQSSVIAQRRAFSRAVKGRAGGICEACVVLIAQSEKPPRTDPVHLGAHAHHIRPAGRGGVHDADNGLWCCLQAHEHIHRFPHESEALGLLLRSTP